MNVGILSVVPSPYQRDLFKALDRHPEITLEVAYLENAAPDSPWPIASLDAFEKILPGRTLGSGRVRCHSNSDLPDPLRFDAYIVNTPLTAVSTQRMFRRLRSHPKWFFWGELLRKNTGFKQLIQNKLARSIERANAIVAIGRRAERDYQERFPSSRVEQLPYFCRLSEFNRERPHNVVPIFLFCGQMIERKGVDLLISAFETLEREGVKAKLLLAGRKTALAEKLPANVDLIGFQSPEKLPELFARADVFVLPSRHDGWGVVINQAIGAGLPIIASTAVGAALDLVDHENNGLLIPPGELRPLTEAIRSLAEDPTRRQSMGNKSAERASQLDPKVGATRWYEILSCASS